uniref:Pyridoxamine 5'-phosphate oxidase n=1 Tax=uncultured gamma proteobacterium HF0500_05P21 TaxID=723572 RepID=E7C4R9_9GAMM|nr:pyridoxamine-phosphate oxidase [uncultured gamma proteobacterium HF0500_05P21]
MRKILSQSMTQNPLLLLQSWLNEAMELDLQPNPDTMAIATSNSQGLPNVRMVLCKEINTKEGYVVFYTNYNSVKSLEIKENPKCSALFHWDKLGYQIRIRGEILQSPDEENDTYFASRHLGSQVGAWASNQSNPVEDREALDDQFKKILDRFNLTSESITRNEQKIPRPPNWGGYRLWIEEIEFWLNQKDRLHDRLHFRRALTISSEGIETEKKWTVKRLQP